MRMPGVPQSVEFVPQMHCQWVATLVTHARRGPPLSNWPGSTPYPRDYAIFLAVSSAFPPSVRRRREQALVAIIQEDYVYCVITRKLDLLVQSLGMTEPNKIAVPRTRRAFQATRERARTRMFGHMPNVTKCVTAISDHTEIFWGHTRAEVKSMPSRRLMIVQQNDSHGYLWSHPELFWTFPFPSFKQGIGGFAKTAHVVKELRKRENVLFVDGGDVFHGTGPVVLSQGTVVPPLLKALDIDVMVPGNWDFAYGPEQLLRLIRESDVSALALNVRDSQDNLFLPPFSVMDKGGIRIGLLGLTYSKESQSMPKKFSQGLTFDLDLQHVSQAVSHLRKRENAQIVIVLSHMGLPADLQLAGDVPDIDIILSAHSHDRLHQLMKVNGTLVMQSGANGSFLGILSFTVNFQGRIDDIEHQLLTLENVDDDKEVADLLGQLLQPYQEAMAEPIGQLGTPLHRMTVLEAPMDHVITDAYLAYSEADIAFSHGWRYGAPIVPGVFTQGDLYGMLPTNPELFSTELDGATLHDFLEQNLENVFASNPFRQKGGYVVRSAGLVMALRSYNPQGHRIEYLAVNNQEVKMHKTYRVVSAGPQGLGIDVPRHSLNVNAHDVVRDYFKRHKPVTVSNSHRVIAL